MAMSIKNGETHETEKDVSQEQQQAVQTRKQNTARKLSSGAHEGRRKNVVWHSPFTGYVYKTDENGIYQLDVEPSNKPKQYKTRNGDKSNFRIR